MSAALNPQRLAADPGLSVFVTANAGSGKTKTLIDRVARLLLAGVAPARILCVTYTKAAAAEMQRRLFELLGDWSVAEDETLRAALVALEGRELDKAFVKNARRLFAAALETPGGLKIQTIHAFCEAVLKRFPLEAGAPPGFAVLEGAAAAKLSKAARDNVALAARGDGSLGRAFARFAASLDHAAFERMFDAFETRRGELADFLEREGGLSGGKAWVWTRCGFNGQTTVETVRADAGARLDVSLLRAAADAFAVGSSESDRKASEALAAAAADIDRALDYLLPLFFTAKGTGTPAAWVERSAVLKARSGLQASVRQLQESLDQVRERMRAATVAAETVDVLDLAAAYLEAFRIEKEAVGALDFADQIALTRKLLTSRAAAAWVLYKLDGGVDHVLVDEAQDTAPEQWKIIEALTSDFFSGAGRPDAEGRQIFVVGDVKQSIYSFQGARPEQVHEQAAAYRLAVTESGGRFERVALKTSWRSTPAVLGFVDEVFRPAGLTRNLQATDDPIEHLAERSGDPGCVDLWELEAEIKDDDPEAWTAPVDARGPASAYKRLADRIAGEIQRLTREGELVHDRAMEADHVKVAGWRPARFEDVLILVRKRGVLFEEILRALKRAGVPVAGADRLKLSEHIVFDDLLALARFVLFPPDELNLAALLKSPLCGLTDEALFDLAYGRGDTNLWDALAARAAERADWTAAHEALFAALEGSRSARPFEFYARLLARPDRAGRSWRRRILARLGSEADEALDEFMAEVLAAEGRGVADLESLAAELSALSIEIKREMDAPRGEVRVMTAHGAKGLEAPIVFLPELPPTGSPAGSSLLITEDGGFLWSRRQGDDCEASAAARRARADREAAESARLLYVALTRARDRLVLCGRISAEAARNPDRIGGWWGMAREAFDRLDAAGQVRSLIIDGRPVRRVGEDPAREPPGERNASRVLGLPPWAVQPVPAEPLARYASPSDLGEAGRSAAPSPLAGPPGLGRFRRGELIHRLLQLLPDLPPPEREAGARALLAREPGVSERAAQEMANAALNVLSDHRFADVFGPGSRAEIPIAGSSPRLPDGLSISGRIDRLVVMEDRVLAVDFKTNRPAPASIEAADPAYIRQMALYSAVLAEIFTGRKVEAAIVWTDGPRLMEVPEFLVAEALAEIRRGG